MNSQDYRDALKDIKPSKEMNDRIIEQVLHKPHIRISRKKSLIIRFAVACIVILSLSGITAMAASFNLADIFKGYFKEVTGDASVNEPINNNIHDNTLPQENDNVSTNPMTGKSAFLKTAGTVLTASDTQAGLKLTARGVVGDDRVLYVAIDVETLDGEAFTEEDEDNLNSIYFQEIKLKIDDDVLGQYCSAVRIDDGSEKGKATYLIHDIIHAENIADISGHHLTITLTNLLHRADTLEDIGMEDNLYDIYTRFPKPADGDYQYYSVRSDGNHTDEENAVLEEYRLQRISGELIGDAFIKKRDELIKAGLLEPLYYLPKTSEKVSFCSKYPSLQITNMGIKDNILTFNMDINDELDYQELITKRLELVNRESGACTSAVMDIDEWEGDENGKLLSAHFIAFHAVTSAEQLKDYYLAIGGEGSSDIVNEGQWTLGFDLSYQDTSRSYTIDQTAIINGYKGTIGNIEISPLSIKISYQLAAAGASENDSLFEYNWGKSADLNSTFIILKDGTKVTMQAGTWDNEAGACTYNAMFPYVINPDRLEKIVIDGTEIPINQ